MADDVLGLAEHGVAVDQHRDGARARGEEGVGEVDALDVGVLDVLEASSVQRPARFSQ